MPKGQKICPKCGNATSPRMSKCPVEWCGHLFTAVAVEKTEVMTKDPLNKQLTATIADTASSKEESVGRAKNLLANIEAKNQGQPRRNFDGPIDWNTPEPEKKKKPESPEAVGRVAINRNIKRKTFVPSGDCPFKPEGFKSTKWATPATKEIIQNWAVRVYNSGDYLPHAVVYWARYYWDMNEDRNEWERVRELILSALTPTGTDHNSEEFSDI